jgi:hypothetical protein
MDMEAEILTIKMRYTDKIEHLKGVLDTMKKIKADAEP